MNSSGIKNLCVISCSGLIVGALLPWVSITSIFGTISKLGIEGDGILTAGLGVVGIIKALSLKPIEGETSSILLGIFGILTLLLIVYDWPNSGDSEFLIQNGVGLYLTLVAGMLLAVGGFSKPSE